MRIGDKIELEIEFNEVISLVKEALKKEGFGVITEIDVKENFKQKLGVEFEDYIILGACNPKFAYGAIKMEKEIGLMLPCNVIVYKENDKVFVSIVDPEKLMNIVENEELRKFSREVKKKLENVLERIKGGTK